MRELEGELERQPALAGAVTEQLGGARHALQDGVAVRVEPVGRARCVLRFVEVYAQRLAQAGGGGVVGGQRPERGDDELGSAPSAVGGAPSRRAREVSSRRLTARLLADRSAAIAASEPSTGASRTISGAGALRDWLAPRGELPAEPLLTMVPVSVRTPEEFGTYGNRVSTMIVPLPTDEPDPARRLALLHEAMRSAKERHKAMPATLLQDANHFIPPALLARAARVTSRVAVTRRLQAPINLVISNVPGSPVPLYCAGAKLEAQFPVSAILDGTGLNITVLSYQDRLDVGVVVDRKMLDDAWQLIDALRASLAELHDLIEASRSMVTRGHRSCRVMAGGRTRLGVGA